MHIGYLLIFHHQRVCVSVYCWGQSRQHPCRWRSGAAGQGRLGVVMGIMVDMVDNLWGYTMGPCDNLSLIMIITNGAFLPSPGFKYSFLVASSPGDRPLLRWRSSRRGDKTISYESKTLWTPYLSQRPKGLWPYWLCPSRRFQRFGLW